MVVLVLWRALFFEFTKIEIPKCLKKNRTNGENVKYIRNQSVSKWNTNYMIPRSNHSNGRCVVLISPDHPYHHRHHCYLHLHFLHHELLHLPLQHIHWHYVPCIIKVLCALKNLISVKPFNINVNQFKPIIK